mmetsp:Transcript_45052/g.141103  ORF Transcript_45052/g.141103 Transcript_45052/m.141103 type:complete len:204 (-) Transcript_45052:15-626(-)
MPAGARGRGRQQPLLPHLGERRRCERARCDGHPSPAGSDLGRRVGSAGVAGPGSRKDGLRHPELRRRGPRYGKRRPYRQDLGPTWQQRRVPDAARAHATRHGCCHGGLALAQRQLRREHQAMGCAQTRPTRAHISGPRRRRVLPRRRRPPHVQRQRGQDHPHQRLRPGARGEHLGSVGRGLGLGFGLGVVALRFGFGFRHYLI